MRAGRGVMIFVASKVFWAVFNPGNLLLAGLCLGAGGLIAPWEWARRVGRALLVLVAVAAAIIASFPVSGLLLRPLESRFQAPSPLPERVDGVVVLGGGIDLRSSVAHDGAELNRSGDRLIALVELARRYPGARLIYSSGSGLPGFPDYREADYAVRLAERLGLAGDRVLVERESRNTRENAIFSRELARPGPGETSIKH